MTGLQTLEARVALGAVAGVAGVLLSTVRAVHRSTHATFRRVACLAFLASRLGLFGVVFLLLGISPRGDIPIWYMREAVAVLGGGLPYRNFESSYAPLHGFVDAAVLQLWRSPLALIVFAICVEFLLFYMWLRVAHELVPERQLRIASVLYVTSALALQFVAIDGQDNVLIALFLLLSLWMAMRSTVVLSGIFTALAAVMVKLIPIFYAPVFVAGLRRRWAWSFGFLGCLGLGYGFFALLPVNILQPLAIEGALKSAGTLPFLLECTTGISLSVRFWDAILLLMLGLLYAVVLRLSYTASAPDRIWILLWAMPATTLVLLLFPNKSWPPYLMIALFPICLVIADLGVWGRAVFAGFSLVALVEQSYWATLLIQMPAPRVHTALLNLEPMALGLLVLQLPLLSGYVWLLRACLLRMLRVRSGQPLAEARDAV